jgi:hypothetical protein
MLKLPIFDLLEKSRNVLIAGAGGGFDIFTGLPLYFALRDQGKKVFLANYSFSVVTPSAVERVSTVLTAVTGDTRGAYEYFPERYLSQWFDQRGEKVPIYTFDRCGVKPMVKGYQWMIDEFDLDTIVLVDGGTDSLLRGNEQELGTPLEDMTSIAAVDQLDIPNKVLVCLGFGIDTFHGVCHADVLESIARMSKEDPDGYLGAFSLLESMSEVKLFREATEHVFKAMPENVSIVCSSILSAIKGEFGNHHATKRTSGSLLFINPLMSLYWCFKLRSVASRVMYLPALQDTNDSEDVLVAIKKFRKSCSGFKTKRSIPF